MIDISGLSKAEILAALFNAASPGGLGFIQFHADAAGDMTVEEAHAILAEGTRFDYLQGRSFKVDLTGDQFDPWLYDRDNGGEGTAEQIIERLRTTGAVSSKKSTDHREAITAQRSYEQPTYDELGEMLGLPLKEANAILLSLAQDGIPVPEANMSPRQHLDWASDQALAYFDKGEYDKCVALFLYLLGQNPDNKWIVSHPGTTMLLGFGLQSKNRYEMERQMKGFAA